jgi:hypothetical protein
VLTQEKLTPLLADTGPESSCRVDYLSLTYKIPTDDSFDALFALALDIADQILPRVQWERVRAGRHFLYVWRHPSGVTLEASPPSVVGETGRKPRNSGIALVSLPGAVWGSLDAKHRSTLIAELGSFLGFYRCTRVDFQITCLEPAYRARDIAQMVEAGSLWPKGFGCGHLYGQRNHNGSFIGEPTQYFGGKQSRILARVYDKAAESDWPIPAVRHELKLTKEPAADHFRRLLRRCKEERSTPPLLVTAEERTTKDVLGQHLDYRDTSQWAGREKPRNWAQTAPKAGWWREMLDHEHSPLTVQYRPASTLVEAFRACTDQYSRKVSLFAVQRAITAGDHLAVMAEFFLSGVQKWKRDDFQLLCELCPDVPVEQVREHFDFLTRLAAQHTEQEPPKWLE